MTRSKLSIGPRGLALIRKFEGLELKAYQDIGGIWTIGYGHTGPDVTEGMVIDGRRAEALLSLDVGVFERCVRRHATVSLTQNQFDAMVALAYNIGCGRFKESTMLRRFNDGHSPESVAEAWAWWNRVNGEVVKGLVNRRRAEIDLFLGVA